MQNIDPLYFLQPIITIAFSAGLVIYWNRKRTFTRAVPVYSFLAYAGAIAIKIVLQNFTYVAFLSRFSANPLALGAYFGVQTVFFEVGGAYLVASWAFSRGRLTPKDAEDYGLGLAFWENAGYLGTLGLFTLLSIYLTLASGGSTAQEFYSNLIDARPDLTYPATQALPLVGYGRLERVTSLLFHFSWGYLCLLAACVHSRRYFLLALPMGLLDFLVPFAPSLSARVRIADLCTWIRQSGIDLVCHERLTPEVRRGKPSHQGLGAMRFFLSPIFAVRTGVAIRNISFESLGGGHFCWGGVHPTNFGQEHSCSLIERTSVNL